MKSILAPVTRIFGMFRYGTRLRPNRDWSWILGFSAVLLVLSAGWNVWLFLRTADGEVIGGETPATPAFDTGSLDAARSTFEMRDAEGARYRQEYRFVDPRQ